MQSSDRIEPYGEHRVLIDGAQGPRTRPPVVCNIKAIRQSGCAVVVPVDAD